MALPYLSPIHVFGLKGDVRQNVHFMDEHSIAYVCGANVVLYHTDTKVQKFVPLGDDSNVATATAISPNRKYA